MSVAVTAVCLDGAVLGGRVGRGVGGEGRVEGRTAKLQVAQHAERQPQTGRVAVQCVIGIAVAVRVELDEVVPGPCQRG